MTGGPDSIFALASGSMHAGVAVVRLSGPHARQALEKLSGRQGFRPRQAVLVTLSDKGKTIDRGLAIYFEAPASFTGEDVVEFHVHGGRAVIHSLVAALAGFGGCRMAEPGEFTRRAFENGKMDLTGAEAVADLIAAETEAQRLQALDQLAGSLSRVYQGWAEKLSTLLAHQEADIEFPDEGMPEGISESVAGGVGEILHEIKQHLNDGRRGERLRSGISIAIVGAPNAGKSSLLNILAQRDVAIVSDQAGTTRDVIEVHLDLGGYPVILADTAGLRDAAQDIEAEGIRRARARAEEADLKIALFDGTQKTQDAATLEVIDDKTIVVSSKSDIAVAAHPGAIGISSKTGAGVEELLAALQVKVAGIVGRQKTPALTRDRHRLAIGECAAALERSLDAALPELAAEDLRLALRALGRVTGRVHVEELLDKIFRDFCIGK